MPRSAGYRRSPGYSAAGLSSGRRSARTFPGISVPDAPVWLHVDAARISQAITNLPTGGRIRLEATADEASATIRVIDSGIGLAPEALTTVFEMFRLILLDVGMPDMNGMEVARELRQHAELAGTRIVA